ncbi:hypothetical protein ACFQ7B_29280 [Streptomyces erythrochromogenes]|uniref:hypothetical protein n=1 Tax=Streptomyces erythrochromogenes TaxID=285574 RepID=UPI0036AF9658
MLVPEAGLLVGRRWLLAARMKELGECDGTDTVGCGCGASRAGGWPPLRAKASPEGGVGRWIGVPP